MRTVFCTAPTVTIQGWDPIWFKEEKIFVHKALITTDTFVISFTILTNKLYYYYCLTNNIIYTHISF